MAEKLTTAEVAFWRSEASSCEHRQKLELTQNNNYPFLIHYYEGVEKVDNIFPHVATKQQQMVINEYFPNTNALISEIMYQSPDIMLDALKPDAEEDTPIMKSALEHFFDRSDSLNENRIALFDMLYAGYCGVEVDIVDKNKDPKADTSLPEEPKEPESAFDKIANKFKKATNEKEAEENLAKISPPIEANFATVQGTYTRRYDPLDVPLDWRAHRLRDRRYNLKKVWMSKAEFDAKYPKFKDLVHAEENKIEFAKHDLLMHSRQVLLYEFQIRTKGEYKTIIISPLVTTSEIDMFTRPYTTNGFNMKIGTLHKYGKLYPKSFAQINKKMNDEMNEYVRHVMDVAQRNVPKQVIDKNKVKSDGKTALRSNKVNDTIEVDGNPQTAVTPLPLTASSFENKELLAIFQDQKNKLWSVSESRVSGRDDKKFATELAIQEQGFQAKRADIQEGLRIVIKEQLETAKDIIATFWDDEVFLKVTGHPKMAWYEPQRDPVSGNILNALANILTADYNVNIDIASAQRKNRREQLSDMFFYMTQLVQIRQILTEQGKDINIDEIRKQAKEFGWNPDTIFVDFKPQGQLTVPTAGGETISPEEDATRQAQAEGQIAPQAEQQTEEIPIA